MNPRLIESSATLPVLSTLTSRRSSGLRTSLLAYGQPWIWLCGGALVICLVMILGLLALVLYNGIPTLWPQPLMLVQTHAGERLMGEIIRTDTYKPGTNAFNVLPTELRPAAHEYVASRHGTAERQLIRIGNFELTHTHHKWVSDFEVKGEPDRPEWGLVVERFENGRFYGVIQGFLEHGKVVAAEPAAAWAKYLEHHPKVTERTRQIQRILLHDIGEVSRRQKAAAYAVTKAALRHGAGSAQHQQALLDLEGINQSAATDHARFAEEVARLRRENAPYLLRLVTADGKSKDLPMGEIVRAYPANRLGFWDKVGLYLQRWWEFVADDPRNANTEGGVFPCIWGTLAMTMIMTIFVVPFGVLAALYLREYARPGPVVSAIRISVNNLAGVPSVVFGVFGLGFFCLLLGGGIDQLFYPGHPGPKFGTGGILWASLTLALLTVPVVIVATEEALAAVPRSMREGSYACGASKWQTIRRIVLPRAMPGILTGMILAMARGAGEVAPLMLVGAMQYVADLPVDGVFPYVHPERSFMHLGFHIYYQGFQSPDSESARPMVFMTTLLLILIVALLNLGAMWLRNRLRRKYQGSQF